jgi:Ser/Thr protein kinase RdoA (MazF antagonist)
MSLDDTVKLVLQQFPDAGKVLESLGNRGGFSGARLWKVAGFRGPLCLRAWPAQINSSQLQFIHQQMKWARAQGLDQVPSVHGTRSGQTWTAYGGRLWDLTSWMPGIADFERQPTLTRLKNACIALGRLHVAWAQGVESKPCPAVLRRLARWQIWQQLVQSGWRPTAPFGLTGPVEVIVQRAWHVLPGLLQTVPTRLKPWLTQSVPLQPCLCDIWHDHILFAGEAVCGIIDYGSMRYDHVAVDLARMLGSLVGDDPTSMAAGLAAYRSVRPLSADEEGLMRVLDETGVLLGTANWLIWLLHERRQFEDLGAVARRLEFLVDRVEATGRRILATC